MGDLDVLTASDGWVVMYFKDGSAQSIHTSLDVNILKRYGAELRENQLFDLDKLRYVEFRQDANEVKIFVEKPIFDSEVLRFASRFI